MMFFNKQKQVRGNTRRTKKVVKPVRKPMRWLKPMLKGLAVSCGLAVIVGGAWKMNQALTVSYWDIDAEPHIQKQVEAYLKQQDNLDYWHSRAAVLQDKLIQQVPDIQYIQVSRVLPDGLLVKAIARHPMALWKDQAAQQVKIIDEKGVAYRVLEPGETLDLPLLQVEQGDLAQATRLLLALNKYDARQLMNLSEVIVAENGWRLNFSRGNQWKLDWDNLEHDLSQIVNILDMPQWAQGNWRLDARFPERWFIRPAKQEVI